MDQEQKNFIYRNYQGKRVFVTGHTGFKGSWLVTWLHEMGADIMGYSLAPTDDLAMYKAANLDVLCKSVIGDIRDKSFFEKTLLDFAPDFVFHLAAQPLVMLSYDQPIDTYETNVIGTGNLLNSLRKLGKSCVVVLITTDKVYYNFEWNYPYRENDQLGGYDPYSSSKAACELLIDSFRNSYFHPSKISDHQKSIASARAGNVIGGGDWANNRIIPDVIRALKEEKKIIIRNPNSVRPWQHVIEPLSGYLLLGAMMKSDPSKFIGAWNFGPYMEDNFPVVKLVQFAIEVWGQGNFYITEQRDNLHEAGLLKLDISKAMNELNWRPNYNSKKAIEVTVNWYKHFLEGGSPHTLILNDIKSYLNFEYGV